MSRCIPWPLGSLAPWPLLLACNVTPATTTGGADLPARGACPRGLAVVSSDFQSSEIALLSPDGSVASPAFLSSASSAASNLAAPLSGDLEAAAARSRDNELVLVDRFGTNVLSFVDAKTATVRAQLPIGTGFDANPQDYLEISEHKAYVPRLSENKEPGREPFDFGSDLLLVDPAVPDIVGSVPMPHLQGFFPNPVALVQLDDLVLVTLQHARPDFSGMADSEVIAVDTRDDTLRYRLTLSGLQNCGRVEISPSRERLVVACASHVDPRGESLDPAKSGIVLLDATREPPEELQRFSALELAGGPIQSSLELVTDDLLLFKTQTALGAEQDNQLMSLRPSSGATEVLASAARDASGAGFGIAFLGMSCSAGCGDPCLVADASRGRVLRLRVAGEGLVEDGEIHIDGAGLPPTGITPFW
jgi:hypothetical protein